MKFIKIFSITIFSFFIFFLGVNFAGATEVTGSVTVNVLPAYTLTTSTSGTGQGVITSSPSGINCGSGNTDCSEAYTSGTSVTLTATPSTGSNFFGWSGACTNLSGTCTVTMNQLRNVTATFNSVSVSNSLNVSVVGSGSVSSSPSGITCPNDCFESYLSTQSVTLTATPINGASFTGWSGACSGTGTCTVSMSLARSVTATFTSGGSIPVVSISASPNPTSSGSTTISWSATNNPYLHTRGSGEYISLL